MGSNAQTAHLLARAERALRSGNSPLAMALYSQLLEQDPLNLAVLVALGALATKSGDLSRARNILSRAVHHHPDRAEAWMALGNALARSGAFDQAATAFSRVVELRPSLAAGHVNLGNALRRDGRIEQAIRSIKKAIALQPDLVAAHFNLGISLEQAGDSGNALLAFERSLELDPTSTDARIGMSNALLSLGRPDEALIQLEHASRQAPDLPAIHYRLGQALQSMGRERQAACAFARAIERDPDQLDARNNRIIALIRSGESAQALQEAMAYRRRAPTDARMFAGMAAALVELGRREEAGELLDFGHLLVVREIGVPSGYLDLASFNQELAAEILAHETLQFEPKGKSTVGGYQTAEFTHEHEGAAGLLRESIVRAVRRYTLDMRESLPGHPYVRGLPAQWRLATWAVSLQSQGYQGPHFHPDGIISGVYYVAVPREITRAGDNVGCLEFGRSNDAMGGSAEPMLHLVQPREGEIVLFPSYFYHRTIPFQADSARISVAFDVIAASQTR